MSTVASRLNVEFLVHGILSKADSAGVTRRAFVRDRVQRVLTDCNSFLKLENDGIVYGDDFNLQGSASNPDFVGMGGGRNHLGDLVAFESVRLLYVRLRPSETAKTLALFGGNWTAVMSGSRLMREGEMFYVDSPTGYEVTASSRVLGLGGPLVIGGDPNGPAFVDLFIAGVRP